MQGQPILVLHQLAPNDELLVRVLGHPLRMDSEICTGARQNVYVDYSSSQVNKREVGYDALRFGSECHPAPYLSSFSFIENGVSRVSYG